MLSTDVTATKFNYSQIGHGSAEADGNAGKESGFIKVFALGGTGNISVFGGEAARSGAQIGTGGYNSFGTNLGEIKLIAAGNLRINSGNFDAVDNWGKVGHGDNRNGGGGRRDGDIYVSVGNNLTMGQAVLGHIDFRHSPGYFSGFTSGDTFIAVGRNNPNAGGPGYISTTAASVITSAGGGALGDLRSQI
jgi:hypothetical protein